MRVPRRCVRRTIPLALLLACTSTEPSSQSDAARGAEGDATMGDAAASHDAAPARDAAPAGDAAPTRDAAPAGDSGAREGGTPSGEDAAIGAEPLTPGTQLDALTAPAADQAAFRMLADKVERTGSLDADGLQADYPVRFRPTLSYDPLGAELLDRIQASALALTDGELTTLGQHGFVISKRREFSTFARGLAEIYAEHLPLYVTADALLEAVHSSYDTILWELEHAALIPELRALLQGMRTRLARSSASVSTRKDADLYLAVALSLLTNQPAAPVAGADPDEVARLVKLARAAQGIQKFDLFNVSRSEDFSQFEPRGHYTDDGTLKQYFRAMIWLGRIDFRLLETQPDGTQVFRREQYLAMLLLHELVADDLPRYARIDETLRTFVGESDYMVLGEVAQLVDQLGGSAAARAATDQEVAEAIVTGGYGAQQIASHLMAGGVDEALPLNRSFALLGQRYVVDSHVFSEVVYDRIDDRLMPTPLDAAFSALGNAQALSYHEELTDYTELPGALGRMRVLVDAHGEDFWEANFYNLWLGALRSLSPQADLTDPGASGLPEVAGTEAWGRRILNTQLGSWAELRYDTLLYAKQSYTGIPVCDFPDAYVDPYPAFYRTLQKYAASGSRVAELLSDVSPEIATKVADYFALLDRATTLLADMAERQLRGEPYDAAQLAFLNEAVRIETEDVVCASIEVPDGWYARLFYQPEKSVEFDPTVADVHTQPADENGNIVGRVLHVGTGYPRLMVATVDTCMGARAYAGVVFAYHEEVTDDFERLTGPAWSARFREGPRPGDVPWLAPVLGE